ncbi:MAG: hypothetical protein K0U66_03860 [Gammaproteobacteria bacterium]|nr:hypothetical protein [Pseudomonadota bacterium]MCH9662781.1 hypothetical protein [Gammaproteobacteria bacterium]
MATKQKNLAIYMTCHHSPYAASRLPPVGDMFITLLSPVLPDWRLLVYDVVENQYPESLETIDAALITGSPASVYDDDEWIKQLHQRTRDLVDQQVPTVGVCFGHQMLASALDGRVERASAGWGLGLKPVHFARRDWMDPAHESLNLAHVHQDQVVEMPTGARRLAGDDFCPNAAFEIGDRVLTVQGHPEFTNHTLDVIIHEVDGRAPPEVCTKARASTAGSNDGTLFARWIAGFINKAR